MKTAFPPLRSLDKLAPEQTAPSQQSFAGKSPSAGEALAEIGLILAIHLAVAAAVTLTLRLYGIA